MGNTSIDCLIIGGGIAGLTVAAELHRRGRQVLLLESQDRVGGVIRTIHDRTVLMECGPNAFLGDAEALLNLADSVGLRQEIVTLPPTAMDRFIYWRGHLHRVPRGPAAFLRSRLLSWRGKCRLLGELFVPSKNRPPEIGTVPISDETVAGFVRRRLGHEALERLIDPFVAGIFAGDPEQLSLAAAFPKLAAVEAHHGGLLRAALTGRSWQARTVRTFREGMGMLPAALAAQLAASIHTGVAVTGLVREPAGRFRVTGTRGERTEAWRAPRVILATPAFVTAALLRDLLPATVAPLRQIPYASLIVAHVAFAARDLPRPLTGFGFLVPRRSPVRLLGALWTSSCFPGRAPEDTFLSTCFYGGMRDPEVLGVNDAALRDIIAADVRATMGIGSAPVHCQITRHRAAIPQYTVGHQQRIAQITSALTQIPGLALTGNYLTGTSVSDTIAHATETVRQYVSA